MDNKVPLPKIHIDGVDETPKEFNDGRRDYNKIHWSESDMENSLQSSQQFIKPNHQTN